MRKILFLLLSIICLESNSQTVTVFSETFSSSTVPNFDSPNMWSASSPSGWNTENGFVLPVCDAANSNSANPNYMLGADATSGTFHNITKSLSTVGFSGLQVTWNEHKADFAGAPYPTVTFSFSTNGGSTWQQVPFTDISTLDTWTSVGVINIPTNAEGQSSVLFRWSYTGPGTGNVIGIDDIHIWGTSSPIFYYIGSGDVDKKQNWNTVPNGSGIQCNSFLSAGQTFKLIQTSNISMNGNWTIGGTGSKLEIGDGSSWNVNLNTSSFTFSVINGATVSIYNNSTLTLNQASPAFVSSSQADFQTGSTVIYSANSTGSIMPGTHYNAVISGGADKNLFDNTTFNGNLNLSNGNLGMANSAAYLLTINGTLSGSGTIKTGNMRISLGGSGNLALNISAGSTSFITGGITLNRSGKVTLNNNLTCNGLSSITSGTLDFSGFTLNLQGSGNINFGGGAFATSSLSTLRFGNTGSISGSLLFDQSSATTRSLKALTLQKTNSSVTLGNSLDLYDSLKISNNVSFNPNGNLRLKSSNSLKARIANISSGSITGNVIVETFAKGGTTDWTNLGVSGVQGQSFSNWYGQIPMAIEGSSTGVTSVGGQYFESVQGWNEGSTNGYDTLITVSSPITVGKGYWVYLGTGLSTTSDMVWTVSGSPVTGNVSIPLTNSSQSGWNLIANPYASPIRWSSLRNGNTSVNNAYYIYDPDLGNSVSFSGGVATPASYQPMADVIPMGQGFYVEATGNTNLTAQESNKVNFNTSTFPLLKSNQSMNSTIGSVIRLNVAGGGYYDDAAIRFHSNATSNYDMELDAHKLYSSPGYAGYPGAWTKRTVISTQLGNEDYSINSLPYNQNQNTVIPVIVRVYTSGSYTISGVDLQNIPGNSCITLFDKVTNITHDLRASDYVCNINDTTYAARFVLTVCPFSTATSINSQTTPNSSLGISKDANGVFVAFDFDIPTDATITACNILGQEVMKPKKVKASKETMYLDLNTRDQLIFVSVETKNGKVTKKILNYN